MTELLKKAFEQAEQLPRDEQDAMGLWLLEELASEKRWSELFAASQSGWPTSRKKLLRSIARVGRNLSTLTGCEVPYNP